MTTLISVSELNISSKGQNKEIYYTNKAYNNTQLIYVRKEKSSAFRQIKIMKSKHDNVNKFEK
jgi:hypothetical protein